MTDTVRQLYQRVREDFEHCYNVALAAPLAADQWEKLRLLLGDGFVPGTVGETPHLSGPRVVEVGPRMNFETAWSTNLVSICRAIHLDAVVRSHVFVYTVDENRGFGYVEGVASLWFDRSSAITWLRITILVASSMAGIPVSSIRSFVSAAMCRRV